MVLRIGNAQGFWGDSPSAAQRLVKQQPDLDYLTLDYLAEVSMSIMAIQREKDHQLGYARDFLDVVESLIPLWKQGSKVKIVTNAGGLNPKACAEACHRLLFDAGCMKKIGIVFGDDVLPVIRRNLNNHLFNHLDNGESIRTISDNLVTANAYLGAHSIAELLVQGAEIIITGRVADPSLTLGPCVAHYQWQWDDYDRLAAGTIAGHLIECGTQVTGGVCTNWLAVPDQAHIGYPVVEVHEDGSFVVTKPKNTGGVVNEQTVKEQLLYEIGDPYNYLSPDVTVSFLDLKLQSDGENRIKITGAKGRPPPTTLKVSATYRDGFKSEAFLTVFGKEAVKKQSFAARSFSRKSRQRVTKSSALLSNA